MLIRSNANFSYTKFDNIFSPYYNDSHRRFRTAIRSFVEREILPFVSEWDENKQIPKELWKKTAEAGFLPAVVGPPWPVEFAGDKVAGGMDIRPDEFDQFHEMILIDETARYTRNRIT